MLTDLSPEELASTVRLEFPIPPQQMVDDKIFVRDPKPVLAVMESGA